MRELLALLTDYRIEISSAVALLLLFGTAMISLTVGLVVGIVIGRLRRKRNTPNVFQ